MTIYSEDILPYPAPNSMTAEERLDEVAAILAAGIIRLRMQNIEKHKKTESIILDKRNQIDPYETNTNNAIEGRVS